MDFRKFFLQYPCKQTACFLERVINKTGKDWFLTENKKSVNQNLQTFQVPGTGFEPAHPFERCHLKAVRLPISPPGQNNLMDCKYKRKIETRLIFFCWII